MTVMLIAMLALAAALQDPPALEAVESDTRPRARFECMTYPFGYVSRCTVMSVTPDSPELRQRARRAARAAERPLPPGGSPPTDGTLMQFTIVLQSDDDPAPASAD